MHAGALLQTVFDDGLHDERMGQNGVVRCGGRQQIRLDQDPDVALNAAAVETRQHPEQQRTEPLLIVGRCSDHHFGHKKDPGKKVSLRLK
jgi:hypothetical protein